MAAEVQSMAAEVLPRCAARLRGAAEGQGSKAAEGFQIHDFHFL